MSRFRATVRGSRGPVSRIGTPASGVEAYVNGWDVGVRVVARAEGDRDVIEVYATGGTIDRHAQRLVATVKEVGLDG